MSSLGGENAVHSHHEGQVLYKPEFLQEFKTIVT